MLSLSLFVKAPNPGQAKTRLTRAYGEVGSAAIAEALLRDSLARLRACPADERIAYITGNLEPEIQELLSGLTVLEQAGETLGDKIERVLQHGLVGCDKAITMGADVPDLRPTDIEKASALLDRHDLVLGPALDGGFYLIGVSSRAVDKLPGLLQGIAWSKPTTMQATLAKAQARDLQVATLAPLADIDRPADVLRWCREEGSEGYRASAKESQHFAAAIRMREDQARTLSVVVPVLNEEKRIVELLDVLTQTEGFDELIIVDGGSEDRTARLVEAFAKRDKLLCQPQLVRASPGRGAQMNLGAKRAKGANLLFLHADVDPPGDAAKQVFTALQDPAVGGGAFRLRTIYDPQGQRREWLRPFLPLADLRSRYTSLPYGDQGIFVRRRLFDSLGGFPEIPLFEDLAFSQKLRRATRIKILKGPMMASARRFQARPIFYTTFVNTMPLFFRAGVSPEWIGRFYGRER